ncbi:hypothetical protein AB1Y20_017199 [Prymnesium parvum]|uniref:Uncharacterized protein n=1 Tax=Prymnesium parvum TaxID=97485 RepID=A0AB34IBX4_PRYPA
MGLREEYATIKQARRDGTLKPAPPPPPPKLWVASRFARDKDAPYSSLGERYNSREPSTIAYSFGHCTLEASLKASIPKHTSNGMTVVSPGPQAYTLKGTFGPRSAQFHESKARRGPSPGFGTDLRQSDLLRDLKSRGQPVDKEMELVRLHSTINTFTRGRQSYRIDTT